VGVGTIVMETVVRGTVVGGTVVGGTVVGGNIVGGIGPEGTGVACGGACGEICAWWGGANVGTYELGYITSLTKERLVEAYIDKLDLNQQVITTKYQRSYDMPGRGYPVRFQYYGEEIPMTVMEDPENVDMGGPFKLLYVTFRRGELIYWGEKVWE
jgi:hypothetical protein